MTEIPDDVMKSVRETLDFDRWTYEDKKDYEAAYKAVARLVLAERARCMASIETVIREGMSTIADELRDPSEETVEMVARAICAVEYGDENAGWENQIPASRAAITAVRGAFFNSESPDRT